MHLHALWSPVLTTYPSYFLYLGESKCSPPNPAHQNMVLSVRKGRKTSKEQSLLVPFVVHDRGEDRAGLGARERKRDLKSWPRIPDLQLVMCMGSAEVRCLRDLILVIIIVSETRHHGNQCIFISLSLGWCSFSSRVPSRLNGWQSLYQRQRNILLPALSFPVTRSWE